MAADVDAAHRPDALADPTDRRVAHQQTGGGVGTVAEARGGLISVREPVCWAELADLRDL